MELEYLFHANQKAHALEARNMELRRIYHELQRADRLQQALISARSRGALRSLVPAPPRSVNDD